MSTPELLVSALVGGLGAAVVNAIVAFCVRRRSARSAAVLAAVNWVERTYAKMVHLSVVQKQYFGRPQQKDYRLQLYTTATAEAYAEASSSAAITEITLEFGFGKERLDLLEFRNMALSALHIINGADSDTLPACASSFRGCVGDKLAPFVGALEERLLSKVRHRPRSSSSPD